MTEPSASAAINPTHVEAMTPRHVEAITDFLRGARISYEVIEHEPVLSAAAEARVTAQPLDEVAKTVVLQDGPAYAIAVIPASERLDLHKLREVVGATRHLQMATEEQIGCDFPALEVGAIPPFGPMVPAAEVFDHRLLGSSRVLCPAGDHRHSVLIDPCDAVGITGARIADICQDHRGRDLVDQVQAVLVDPSLHTDTRMRLAQQIRERLRVAHRDAYGAPRGSEVHERALDAHSGDVQRLLEAVLVDPNVHTDVRMRLHGEIASILAQSPARAGR